MLCILLSGEQPAEKPAELLAELDNAVQRLEYIIAKINLSNCTIKVDGKTLTEIIAKKESEIGRPLGKKDFGMVMKLLPSNCDKKVCSKLLQSILN